ncbi:MAG: hypothetical protein NVSMB29_20170 [Candidatus Dormibacteria bacterium]
MTIEALAPRRCSLWSLPTGETADRLKALRDRLAAAGTGADFQIHCTIYGHISIDPEEAARRIDVGVREMAPHTLRLVATGLENEFFRALYLRVEPTVAVLSAHRAAAVALGLPEYPAYFPHLSLLYSSVPAAERRQLASELGIDLPVTVNVDSVALFSTEGDDTSRWRELKRWPLGHQ